jgi:hypothetical protein
LVPEIVHMLRLLAVSARFFKTVALVIGIASHLRPSVAAVTNFKP